MSRGARVRWSRAGREAGTVERVSRVVQRRAAVVDERACTRSRPHAHLARRGQRVATSAGGPRTRGCIGWSRRAGRRSASGPRMSAGCRASSSTRSRGTCAAGSSSMAWPTSRAGDAGTRWWWRSRARVAGSARRARGDAWRTSRRTWWMRCCPGWRSGSGCARCRGNCGCRWRTTGRCVPTCSGRSSGRCSARCGGVPSERSGCAPTEGRRDQSPVSPASLKPRWTRDFIDPLPSLDVLGTAPDTPAGHAP